MRKIDLDPDNLLHCRRLGTLARKWTPWPLPIVAMDIGAEGLTDRSIHYRHPNPLSIDFWSEMNKDLHSCGDTPALRIALMLGDTFGFRLHSTRIVMEAVHFGLFAWEAGETEKAVLLAKRDALTGHELLSQWESFLGRREAYGDGLGTTEEDLVALHKAASSR